MAAMTIHPKVGMPAFAGVLTSLLIKLAKDQLDIDLSGYESDITVLIMVVVGYLTPSDTVSTPPNVTTEVQK